MVALPCWREYSQYVNFTRIQGEVNIIRDNLLRMRPMEQIQDISPEQKIGLNCFCHYFEFAKSYPNTSKTHKTKILKELVYCA